MQQRSFAIHYGCWIIIAAICQAINPLMVKPPLLVVVVISCDKACALSKRVLGDRWGLTSVTQQSDLNCDTLHCDHLNCSCGSVPVVVIDQHPLLPIKYPLPFYCP